MCGVSKKPSVQKLWRGKANMQMLELTVSRFRAVSGPTNRSSYVKGNWWVECCFRQARYRRRPARHSYAHAQYIYTTLVYVRAAVDCRFCTLVLSLLPVVLHHNSDQGDNENEDYTNQSQ